MTSLRAHGAHTSPNGYPPITLPAEAQRRLQAEVVHWGLEQARRGQPMTEAVLQREYDRRLREAQERLREIEAEYERSLHAHEERLRARLNSQRRAFLDGMNNTGTHRAQSTDRWALTRRTLLGALGLIGIPAATAFGVVKGTAAPAVAAAASDPYQLGGDTGFRASPDYRKLDNPKLAAETKGESMFTPFYGPTKKPWPNHLDRLFPPPPQRARQGRVREFTLTVQEKVLEIADGVRWSGWTYDGTIPGPIIRVTEGDHVRVTLKNTGSHPHSIHFHSIHPSNQDGVFQVVAPGGTGTYEFDAEPFGVYPYHCHTDPIDQHTFRGLYGVMIIDPPEPRPPAKEMVMLMNGYDINFDGENELYSVNGLPGYYFDNPIQLKTGELNRVYVVNMTEIDAVNSFHLHANMFQWYPAGTSTTPLYLNDVVHLGVGDRGILEFTYKFPGKYMFHAHQNELTVHGWKGLFRVV